MTNHKDADLPVALDGPPAPPESVPQLVITLCGGGSCPAIYHTDHDTVLVAGHAAGATSGVTVSDGELLVEIPRELLLKAARQIQENAA